ncbi:hypothetical protein C2S53_008556 [Perilla frutescens var. hirtella]|uniref:Myb/SANT-like domain-containing protein n=1 Tax=Perilla frutescens var. hirtella TaxID=608512 RepID=A0AAD4PE00_PERFH|nr:hypothetical protein C2S53_008556 [Perilla frutescens var. hirtella]
MKASETMSSAMQGLFIMRCIISEYGRRLILIIYSYVDWIYAYLYLMNFYAAMTCSSHIPTVFELLKTMSSAMEGNNDCRVRGNKSDKTRRSWSTREEEVLLAALKELVVQGWKSYNGFRAGYWNKLEEAMKKEFPSTDLKGMSHINSKTTTWKKNYYSLSAILNRSGVGFNLKGTHMIECNDEQWDQIVKSWPHLDAWREIFGKDRATGENAEDVMDVVNELHQNQETFQLFSEGKNRKNNDGFFDMVELLAEINRMVRTTDKRLETIASRIGYDFDQSKVRKDVFDRLSNIEGLSINDKFDICEILAKEVDKMDIFMGLPDEAKTQYVMRLLALKYGTL